VRASPPHHPVLARESHAPRPHGPSLLLTQPHPPALLPPHNPVLLATWQVRASVYSLFRVPLNAIVVCVLLISLSSATTFLLCSGLQSACLAAAIATMRTARRRERQYTGELAMPTREQPAPAAPFHAQERTPLVSAPCSAGACTSSRTSSTC
jgi:hypothetical protein